MYTDQSFADPRRTPEQRRPPRRYGVVVHHDERTSYVTTVVTLATGLGIALDEAEYMTELLDVQGRVTHGSFTRDVAETKAEALMAISIEEGESMTVSFKRLPLSRQSAWSGSAPSG